MMTVDPREPWVPQSDDDASFVSVPEANRSISSIGLGLSVTNDRTMQHTHEAYPQVWVQTFDPRWVDANQSGVNNQLKIGDIWVATNYATYINWQSFDGDAPAYKVFNGKDWKMVGATIEGGTSGAATSLILASPNGTAYQVTVANDGSITTTAI